MQINYSNSFNVFTVLLIVLFSSIDVFAQLSNTHRRGGQAGVVHITNKIDNYIIKTSNNVNIKIKPTNFPNPFTTQTTIKFGLNKTTTVYLAVYDSNGNKVVQLIDGDIKAKGNHQINFDAVGLPKGIYYYQITTEKGQSTGKMLKQ